MQLFFCAFPIRMARRQASKVLDQVVVSMQGGCSHAKTQARKILNIKVPSENWIDRNSGLCVHAFDPAGRYYCRTVLSTHPNAFACDDIYRLRIEGITTPCTAASRDEQNK